MKSKYDIYETYEDVQSLINLENIQNPKELRKKYPKLYIKCMNNDWLKKLCYLSRQISSENYDSIEKVQNLIIQHNINTRTELKKKFKIVYNRCCVNKWFDKLLFKDKKDRLNWENLNDIDSIQDFININNIQKPSELENNYVGLYSKILRNKWSDKLYYPLKKKNFKNITLEEIQNYLDENNISSPSEFNKLNHGLYNRCLNNKWLGSLTYISKYKSSWESSLETFLELNKVEFIIQYESYSIRSKIDLFLPNFNIAIEVQGPGHLSDHCMGGFSAYLKTRKSDIKKNRWCREQGITLLYFSYDKSLVEKYGYPWYIYTSEKELLAEIERIKSL